MDVLEIDTPETFVQGAFISIGAIPDALGLRAAMFGTLISLSTLTVSLKIAKTLHKYYAVKQPQLI